MPFDREGKVRKRFTTATGVPVVTDMSNQPTSQVTSTASGAVVAGVVVMALALSVALFWAQPPSPKPATAPADQFAAGRAMGLVERLLGNGEAHPAGTEANALVAERINGELTKLGLQAESQETFACSSLWAQCGNVTNVMARLPGQAAGPAVLLTAHYDSVPAGPGAADDMAGVAAMLEIARILSAEPTLRNPVILLFSDAEEPGLLGAEAFVAEHPWADEIGVVVNLEANGTRGQSILFETSDNNAWLIDAFAGEAPRPVANSLFYEIYKYLPNNTDLTVYRSAGLPGINFAFTEGGALYHTPLDNLANLDPGSVQHHGDNALAAVRAFASRDLTAQPSGNSIFIDLFPGMVLRWPEPWTVGIALACLLVWLATAARLFRRGDLSWSSLLVGSCVLPVSLVLASLLGFALTFGIGRLTGALMPWYATPLPTRIALWAVAFISLALVALLAGRRAGFWGLSLGVWFWWGVLAILTAWLLPGASVVFLIPAIPALLALAAVAWTPLHGSAQVRAAAAIVGLFVASWFWLPFAMTAETLELGPELGAAVGFSAVLAASGFAPLLAAISIQSRWPRLALAATAGVVALAAAAALFVSPYSAAAPRQVNVVHIEDRLVDEAYWVLEGGVLAADGGADAPEPLFAAASFDDVPMPFLPWSDRHVLVAPSSLTDAPGPSVDILDDAVVDGERVVTVRLQSPRGGNRISLYVPVRGDLQRIDVKDRERPVENFATEKGYQGFHCIGVTCDGLELTLHLAGLGPLNLLVVDTAPLSLPEGDELLKARPETARPRHDGDRSLLFDWVELGAA